MATLTHAAMDPSSLAPPQQGGLLRSVGLALIAHALLIAALTWGVHWKSQEMPAVEAEIWSSVRQQAAPRAVEPPAVQPEPPKPQPKVEPPPAPPAPPKVAPPPDTSVRDAQIALEREKQERERKERERELAERREQQKKAAAEKQRQEELAEAKREAQQKAEAQKKLEAQKKAEAQQKAEAEERKAAEAAEAKRKQQQQAAAKAAEEKAAEARRQENIRRMQGLAGASGGPGATGSALQSSGPSASYGGRVAARVRPNIVFPDSVPGNPAAEVEVRTAPDGTIVGRRLTKSSGNKAWDDAVLRAIDKTETLPRDTDGRVPSLLTISFRPKD